MYCTGCGNTISKNQKFCTKCGAAVKKPAQSSSQKLPGNKASPAGTSKSASSFYVKRDHKNYGPYPLENLIVYARQGKVLPSDMVRSQSEGGWKRADKVSSIASVFSEEHTGVRAAKREPKQKKGKQIALFAGLGCTAVLVFGFIVFLVFRLLGSPYDSNAWDYEATIESPITMQAGKEDINMGDITEYGLLVQIPQGAFDQQTQVTLSHPQQAVYMDSNGLSPLGVPLMVEIEGQQKRLGQPAKIIIGFDSTGIKEQGAVFAAYYHDLNGWELFKPDMVDLEKGIMGFHTYHFSEFCAVQADQERRIEEAVKKRSIEEFANTTWGEQSQQEVERMVKQLLKESLNVPPESKIAQIITRAVIEEIPGGKYGLAIYDGKPEDFTNEVLSKTFEHITYNGDSLQELGVEAGPIAAMSRAAAAFSEGQYEEALKHLSEGIADSVPAVKKFKKVGETTIKVTKHIRDDLYLEAEMMKAFDVYKNGSDAGRYGYNLSAGDWVSVVAQGHGFFSKFSDEELAVLKKNFDNRIERWEEIDRIESANKAFIELMQQKGYLNYGGNPMISEKGDEDLEMLINRLFRISDRIRAELGRYEMVIRPDDFEVAGHSKEDANLILAEQLAVLIEAWYTGGQEAYADKMVELGLIEKQDIEKEEKAVVAEQQTEPVYEKEFEEPPSVDPSNEDAYFETEVEVITQEGTDDYIPEEDYYEIEDEFVEEQQEINMSLAGIWDRSNGEVVEIQGSTAVFLSFCSTWQPAVDAGFVGVGSQKWVNIVQIGENQWACNNLWYYWVDNKPYSVGWCDGTTTITMDSDGMSIKVQSSSVHPYDGGTLTANPTYRRQ